ncbi:MAG: hypothetical protein IT438_15090 [Phycisphaerales bacterium]|nr:hypothetical protein [Phycisphaerales bacterium]
MSTSRPNDADAITEVSVQTEREVDRGWVFEVVVHRGESQARHDVSLSWVDYEHWSHGAAAPERVAKAVVECLVALDPSRTLPRAFDAATARRWAAGFDERLRDRLGDGIG